MNKLTIIQSELNCPKNQKNTFGNYNYRSCEDILEALKPLLKREGLYVTITDEVKECVFIKTSVVTVDGTKTSTHESNGMSYIEATATLYTTLNDVPVVLAQVKAQAGINPNRKGMDIAQCFGASSSYARKYALNGLFLIDDNRDPDATNTHDKDEPKPRKEYDKRTVTTDEF